MNNDITSTIPRLWALNKREIDTLARSWVIETASLLFCTLAFKPGK